MKPIRLVETRRGCEMLEKTPRYDVYEGDRLHGQLYFNLRGYVGTLPLPDGTSLTIGEKSISAYRREVLRLNREARETKDGPQTLMVVCPKHLTQLFGCPEWVKLPTKINERAEYTAHNRRFVVCSVGRGRLYLECPLHDSRTLFGTPEETAERIGYTFERGKLPSNTPEPKSRAAYVAENRRTIEAGGARAADATYDAAGNCTTCGESGRCPGVHPEPADDFTLRNEPAKAPKLPKPEPMRQAVLFSGMDCLPGQEDLFPTE